jgi:hypothetical protein
MNFVYVCLVLYAVLICCSGFVADSPVHDVNNSLSGDRAISCVSYAYCLYYGFVVGADGGPACDGETVSIPSYGCVIILTQYIQTLTASSISTYNSSLYASVISNLTTAIASENVYVEPKKSVLERHPMIIYVSVIGTMCVVFLLLIAVVVMTVHLIRAHKLKQPHEHQMSLVGRKIRHKTKEEKRIGYEKKLRELDTA